MHPFVNGSDGVVDFEVAGRVPQGRLPLRQRVIELGAGGEGARHPMEPPGQLRRFRQGFPVPEFGLFEQARGPQRIAVEGERTGIFRRGGEQRRGLGAGRHELRHPQGRLHDAGTGRPGIRRRRRLQRPLVRVERIGEAAFAEEFVTELEFELARL